MSSRVPAPARYQLGPLERRGILGLLRPGQAALTLASMLGGSAAVTATRSGAGLVLASAILSGGLALAFLPIHQGRTADEIVPAVLGYLRRHGRRRDLYRSAAAETGFTLDGPAPRFALPAEIGRVDFLEAPYGHGTLGVLADRQARTYLAVIACAAQSFVLLDAADKAARLAGFAEVAKALARQRSAVRRLQVMEMVVPGDRQALQRHFDVHQDPAAPAEALASYQDLIGGTRTVTGEHRVYVVAALDPGRASRAIRSYGGRNVDVGATAVLAREVRALIRRLERASIEVREALSPRALAALVACAYDPDRRPQVAKRIHVGADFEGVDPRSAWPGRAGPEHPDHYRHAGVVSTTYWVAEWPRVPVHGEFLAPLLVSSNVLRTFSLVYEGVAPAKAMRQATFAKTSDLADDALRQKLGFLNTARRRNQLQAVERREQELADGHVDVRYTAWVTVTARDPEELEVRREEVEELASQCRLELQVATCEQARAFVFGALPLARGLKRAGALT